MEYKFLTWGPFVFQTKFDKDTLKEIKNLCKKDKKESANHQLAGHIKEEYNIDKAKYMELIQPAVISYIEGSRMFYKHNIGETVEIKGAWVNFMKAGEFNPPHVHTDCHLSSVLYLDVPNLKKERDEYKGTHHGPGSIEFLYGDVRPLTNNHFHHVPEEGDFFMFPFNTKHYVSPFKSKGTRISVAANFIVHELK